MAYILCIETATTNCSVSLSKDGKLLAFKEDNSNQYSHAERLHGFINDVLEESGTPRTAINAIAVSKGPGSYTGLRIGVSAAKGLCFGLDCSLLALPTLEILANKVVNRPTDGVIIPLLDARRMEVYTAVYDASYTTLEQTKALVLDENSFSSYLNKGPVTFIGNGVEKFKAICTSENAYFIEDELPSSLQMIALAYDKYKISDTEDVAYFEPYYLKDFKVFN